MIRRRLRPLRAGTAIFCLASMLPAGAASPEVTLEPHGVLLSQSDLTPTQRLEMLARTTGTIVGTVREAGTGRPLENVMVRVEYHAVLTKADGRFRLIYINPGEVTVLTWRRDLIDTSQRAHAHAGRETTVDPIIRHAPPACCRLAGTWTIHLVRRDPGRPGTEATGLMVFGPDIRNPLDGWIRAPVDDRTLDESGAYDIDLAPMLGEDITTRPRPGNPDPSAMTEATGYVHWRNEISITLIPRMSHGGLDLTGTIDGDEIRGTWSRRGLGNQKGDFMMLRKDN